MAQKRTNLVAGRLGVPAEAGPPGRDARERANYGIQRLGITSRTEQDPPERARHGGACRSRGGGAESPRPTAHPPAEGPPGRPAAEDADSAETFGFPDAPSRRPGRRTLVLAAPLGGVLAIGLVLLGWWCLRDSGGAPRAALGGDGAPKTGDDLARAAETTSQSRPGTPSARPAAAGTRPAGRAEKPPARRRIAAAANRPTAPAAPGRSRPPTTTPGRGRAAEATRPSPPPRPRIPRSQPTSRPARPPGGVAASTRPAPGPATQAAAARDRPDPKGRNRPTTAPSRGPGGGTPATVTACPPGIEVSGIVRGLGGPVAIINNRFVRVGRTVEGAKVVRIGEFSVEIEFGGRRFLIGVASPTHAGGAGQTPPPPEPADEEHPDTADGQEQDES